MKFDNSILPKARATPRVLVVDDSAAQRELLKAVLTRMGLDVVTAPDAAQALFMCMMEDGADIKLILTDWQMPGMDGPDFCRTFRQLARDDYAYIVLMTSETDRATKARGLDAGADDFITRPLDLTEFKARINTGRRILEMQEVLRHRNHEVRTALEELTALQQAIDRDLAEARKLQRAFMPAPTFRAGASDLALRLITSGQIGGDLVGYFPVSEDVVALYSVDVSGHGIASALLTGRLAGLFTWSSRRGNIAFRRDGVSVHSPEEVMARLNAIMLTEMTSDIYFTAVLAYANVSTGRIRFCQAGHPHPLIRRADGRVERAGGGGPPVGLLPGVAFDCTEVQLEAGDGFLAYSDGLTECADTWGDMLEEEGLMTVLATTEEAPEPAIDTIEAALKAHCGINQFDDDISMLLFRYSPPGASCQALPTA